MDRTNTVWYESNMPALAQSVLDYDLFGETAALPDVIHCETIAARSRLHGWKFPPHRHGRLHQVLLIERGGGKAVLEGIAWPLSPRQAVNVPRGCIHQFAFRSATDGWVVTLASEMVEEALAHSGWLRRAVARPSVHPATPDLRKVVRQIFDEHAGRDFARSQVLRSLSGVLLGLVARSQLAHDAVPVEPGPERLFQRFEALLETHFPRHWTVSHYAEALGITPVHLTRIAKAAAGKPASRLIDERIIREARRNLVYTNLPVATVAYSLGFDDPAYFSRVFARVTGLSPRRFRERVGRD